MPGLYEYVTEGGEKNEESGCSGSLGKIFCSKPKTCSLIESTKERLRITNNSGNGLFLSKSTPGLLRNTEEQLSIH